MKKLLLLPLVVLCAVPGWAVDVKISQLPVITTPAAADKVPMTHAGVTSAASITDIHSTAPQIAAPAMSPAHQINVTKKNQTETLTANQTFTLSATPPVNTWFGWTVPANSSGPWVFTLPVGYTWYSEAAHGNRTAFVVDASQTATLSAWYDGTICHLYGDPVSIEVGASVPIAALNIDWSAGNSFYKTLGANSTFTFSNMSAGQTICVALTNTVANYTVTWPTVSWVGGVAPTQTVGAKTDVYTFIRINGVTYGNAIQNF